MSDRPFDIVLYGASGFTGAYVIEEFFKSGHEDRHKFAVAGRNEKKLREVLSNVGKLIGKYR
jgi:short subunit dehydrogenase-like uncharacterized protein